MTEFLCLASLWPKCSLFRECKLVDTTQRVVTTSVASALAKGTTSSPAPAHLALEAARCLFCHDAPCVAACPTGIDVPLFIRQLHTGNPVGAARTILRDNVLGYSCGAVCPTQQLCEGACVLNADNHKPIAIGALQQHAVATVLQNTTFQWAVLPPTIHPPVAVVGAGPAGLACALALRQLGHPVSVYEAAAEPGGLNYSGVASYKLSVAEARAEVAFLLRQGQLTVHTHSKVVATVAGPDEMAGVAVPSVTASGEAVAHLSFAEVRRTHAAMFLALGLGASHKLHAFCVAEGELFSNVWPATDWIRGARLTPGLAWGKLGPVRRVAVVGSGNTAMDAALWALACGAVEVTVLGRRPLAQWRAYPKEIERVRRAGGQLWDHCQDIVPQKGHHHRAVGTLHIVRQGYGQHQLPVDGVILAVGQEKPAALLEQLEGLAREPDGRVRVDEHYRTTLTGVYAGGDCVNGGREVVHAVQDGKLAAHAIHADLVQQTTWAELAAREVACHGSG